MIDGIARSFLADLRKNVRLRVLVGLLALTGCGAKDMSNMGGDEGTAIAGVVELLNDYKARDDKIPMLFAKADGLPTAEELNKYSFYVVGKPSVESDSATSKILVERADGNPIGEREWSFKKVDGSWKIETASFQ
jgi:hypothetical protein